MSDLGLFIAAFFVSAFSGLAACLRTQTDLQPMRLTSALLNSGLLGLGVCMLWYYQFQDRIYTLIGVCILLGLSGQTALDWVLKAFRQGGLSINVGDRQAAGSLGGNGTNDPNKPTP